MVVVAWLATGASCTDPPAEEPSTAANGLIVPTGAELWTTRGNLIPVCFLNGTVDERAAFRATVERTWVAAAAITVRWSDACPFTGTTPQVRVSFRHAAGAASHGSATIGTAAAAPPTAPVWCLGDDGFFVPCPGVDVALGTDRADAEYQIIHLFGHVLGFANDELIFDNGSCRDRTGVPDGTGHVLDVLDRQSVMYGCGERRPFLSELDRKTVAMAYGRRPDRRDRVADLDGDGRAEPIATNRDSTWALRSGGFGFDGFHWVFGAFYGSVATLYGDVTGDGLADGVAINADGAYVAVSDGTTLQFNGRWTPLPLNPFDGNGRYQLAEVNGDGHLDLVQVEQQVYVALSTGTSFAPPGHYGWPGARVGADLQHDLADVDGDGRAEGIRWMGPEIVVTRLSQDSAFDLHQTYHAIASRLWVDRELGFGDVDGDGRADLIAVSYDGVDVIRSFETPVLVPERWTTAPFWGSRATLFGDVNGDGRTDLIAVNDDGDWVALSDGTGFVPFGVRWTTGPFYSLP